MGVFDDQVNLEMSESSPEAAPVEQENATVEGQEEEPSNENEAPAEVEQEVEKETTEPAKQEVKEDKPLLAGVFKNQGELVNGIAEAAHFLNQKVDWKQLTSVEEMESFYKSQRADISRGKINNFGPENVAEINQQNNNLNQELEKIISDSQAILQAEPEEDIEENPEEFGERFIDNPHQALKEHDAKIEARLTKKFEAQMNIAGANLVKQLAPVLEMAQEAQSKKYWDSVVDKVGNVIAKHGDNDLENHVADVIEYMKANPELIDQKEKGLMFAYQQVKLQKQLAEFAKTQSEQDTAKINGSKKGLSLQGSVGGGKTEVRDKNQEKIDSIYGTQTEKSGIFSR